MSSVTSKLLLSIPSAALGVSVSPPAGAWVYSSWVVITASAPTDMVLQGFSMNGSSWTNADFEVEFGVGSSGNEVPVARVRATIANVDGHNSFTFPVPMNVVSAGDRVSVRVRSSSGGTTATRIALSYYDGTSFDSTNVTKNIVNVFPGTGANGVTITPPGTAWANSAYAELTPATDAGLYVTGLQFVPAGTAGIDFEIDLATGASGSETVIHTIRGRYDSADSWIQNSLPMPVLIAQGTRLAVRLRKGNAVTTAWRISAPYIYVAQRYTRAHTTDTFLFSYKQFKSHTTSVYKTSNTSTTVNNYLTATSSDDAFEVIATGAVDTTSAQIYVRGDNDAGFRFQSIALPQGTSIVSANLKYTNDSGYSSSGGAFGGITGLYGEAVDNSATFSTATSSISSRPRTTAFKTNTQIGDPANLGANGVDVTTIVQEIINRGGWASGNALSLIWVGSGTASNYYLVNTIDSTGSQGKAQLAITTTVPFARTITRNHTTDVYKRASVTTVSPNTADGVTVGVTPTIQFTGTNTESADITYEVQIDSENTFDTGTTVPSIVQSTKYTGTVAQKNMTFTLPQAPTVGNLLVAAIMYYTGDDPFTTPAGWTLQSNVETAQPGIAILTRIVQAGDTSSWNLSVLSVNDQNSGAMYEIAGQSTGTFINQLANHTNSTASTSNVGPNVTPTVLNCLALSFTVTIGTLSSPAITSGWTIDQTVSSTFQPALAAHRNLLTTDTTTAISNTVTGLSSAQNATTTLLIAGNINPVLIDSLSSANAGFVNAGTPADTDPFNSGQTINYTVQSPLTSGVYYWRVRGRAPSGSLSFGSWTTGRSFTVSSAATLTRTHTTSVNKLKATSKVHTTDVLKRAAFVRTHLTDTLKRKQNLKAHTTDTLKRKTNTKVHSTDVLKRKAITRVHSTDILKRLSPTRSHTTSIHLTHGTLLTSLVSYWPFDDGSGTNVVDKNNLNPGTWQGTLGSQWGTGRVNTDGVFNGTDNYVLVGNNPSLSFNTGNLTLAVWVKTTASIRQTAVHKYQYTGTSVESGYYIDMMSNGTIRTVYETTNANIRNTDGSIAINDGNWHHVVFVRPSTTGDILIYIDGALDTGATHPFNLGTPGNIDNTTPFAIGQGFSVAAGTHNWTGQLDEVGVWSRALTASEIASLYNAGLGIAFPLDPIVAVTYTKTHTTDTFKRLAVSRSHSTSVNKLKSGNLRTHSTSVSKVTNPLQSGLSAYWKLDEGSGTTAADSLGSHNGTWTGTPSWSTGKINGGINTSAGAYIDAGSNPIIGNVPFTASAWLNANAITGYKGAFSLGNSVNGMYIGTVGAGATDGTALSFGGGLSGHNIGSGVTTTGAWVHVVMTFAGGAGGAVKIYVNGNLTNTVSATPNMGAGALTVGSLLLDNTSTFPGLVDEVGLWNRELTSTEVASLYAGGDGRSYPFTTVSSTRTHTTSIVKRVAPLRSHTTDTLKRTVSAKTHTTDVFKASRKTLSHTTDTLKRSVTARTHSTDVFKRGSYSRSHSTDVLKRASRIRSHLTDIFKRGSYSRSHFTDVLKRANRTISHTTDTLKRKQLTRTHLTDVNKRKATTRTHTTDINLRKAYTRTHTTSVNKRLANIPRFHTTDVLKRAAFIASHATDVLLRMTSGKYRHKTDTLLRAADIISHSTDVNKLKITLRIHTTDVNKRQANINVAHSTDINKRKSAITLSHSTDIVKRGGGNKTHTTDVLKRAIFSRSHSTDTLKRKQFTRVHSTDTLKRKATSRTHTTDVLKRAINLRSHLTDVLKRKVYTLAHSTDTFKRLRVTKSHTTDVFGRRQFTLAHSTSVNKRKTGVSRFHTTDTLKRLAHKLVHSTDTLLREQSVLTHNADVFKRGNNGIFHVTDIFLRSRNILAHTTDVLKASRAAKTHLTDVLKRKQNTRTHSTDVNRRKAFTRIHTTGTFLRAQLSRFHKTDVNKRKATVVFHTTDINKLKSGNLRTHLTDVLKRKAIFKTHLTDVNKRKVNAKTHSTDTLKRQQFTKSHTTSVNKLKTGNARVHTTDVNKRKLTLQIHLTDILKRAIFSRSHSTSVNKRKVVNRVHSTDVLKRKVNVLSHSTDVVKLRTVWVSQTTDIVKRKAFSLAHSTDTLKRTRITLHHSTSIFKRRQETVYHTTDVRTRTHQKLLHSTDVLIRSLRGRKMVLIGTTWRAKPVYVLIAGVWQQKRVRVLIDGQWILTHYNE